MPTVHENGGRRLTDGQRLLVVLAAVSSAFLLAMSWGMRSLIPLVVALVLLMACAVSIFVVTARTRGGGIVTASAYVISAPAPPVGMIVARADVRLLVELPAGESMMVRVRDPAVPVTKWPQVGMALPVEVTLSNPRQPVRILWNLVQAHRVRTSGPAGSAGMAEDPFTVPFFTEYSASPVPGQRSGTGFDEEPPMFDEEPPIYGLPLDEPFPPAGVLEEQRGGAVAVGRAAVPPPRAAPDIAIVDPARTQSTTAAAAAEENARAADYELPLRGIPRPRPASSDLDDPVRLDDPPLRLNEGVSSPFEALSGSLEESFGYLPEPAAAGVGVESVHPGGQGDEQGVGIMLIVSNLERSLRFYADLLHFSVVDATAGSAVLSHGGGRVLLHEVADMSPVERRVVHLHVQVPDVEAAYRELKAQGVKFAHQPRVMKRGEKLELSAATFRDPDGHAIALTQWRPA